MDIAFADPALPTTGALVVLIGEGGELPAEARLGSAVAALDIAEFKGRRAQTATLLAPAPGLSRLVAVGLGKEGELTDHYVEEAGGHAAGAVARDTEASIWTGTLSAERAAHVALGAVLRLYRFDRYRTAEKPEEKPRLAKLTILTPAAAAARVVWDRLRPVADGVVLARDLVSEPANVLTPAELARRCEALGGLGLEIEVFGPQQMTELGFGALMGVANGSVNEPRMVVMQWHGAGEEKKGRARKAKEKPVAFIGKGVTFDTGGISIKPAAGMEDMKWDMAGAGAVIGLMAALAGRKAKVDAIGLVGLVENMPSATAQRPGDVVTTYSGQTVEVINTDAEGRLVLADVLWYCQQRFEPRFMIDLATLTGAIIVGLGHEHAGLFSNDDDLSAALAAAGTATGEAVWRMPMGEAYDKQIKSDIADMKNVSGRPGSAITAAQFIARFVNGKTWAHLDIAGMAWSSKDAPTIPKGATAFGVRLLDRLVADRYEAK